MVKKQENNNLYILFFSLLIGYSAFGQKIIPKKNHFSPYKVGFVYSLGNEKNFLFDDDDYYYQSEVFKAQIYYLLTNWKGFVVDLVFQPQVQHLRHQLLNEQFVLPTEVNYLDRRTRFTNKKNMSLLAFETAFQVDKKLFHRLYAFIRIGLGIAFIDTETERLAKGFTFIENGSLGFHFLISNKLSLQVHAGVGHVSNFDLQQPNSGYNTVNSGIGFAFLLH